MRKKPRRNSSLIDGWSLVHFFSSAALCWCIGPLPAWIVTTLWEPLEVLVLSPLLMRKGIVFGHEGLHNSLSDIVFNTLGVVTIVLVV
jgi:hypothetical protein